MRWNFKLINFVVQRHKMKSAFPSSHQTSFFSKQNKIMGATGSSQTTQTQTQPQQQQQQPQVQVGKITFVGGKDDRTASNTGEDIEGKIPTREGTWISYTLTINDDGTWTTEEQGGHQLQHSCGHSRITASGAWTINPFTQNYEFIVYKFEHVSSQPAEKQTHATGTNVIRSVSSIQGGGVIKSLFWNGEMKRI